jgi:hypothetical protein
LESRGDVIGVIMTILSVVMAMAAMAMFVVVMMP